MPNSEITHQQVAEWITALRSGDYKQGKGSLATIRYAEGYDNVKETTHCCLGVYGVLNGGKVADFGGLTDLPGSSMNENSFVPYTMMAINAQHLFSELNDTLNLTFNQIASIAAWLPLRAYQDASWWSENSERITGLKKGLDVIRYNE